MMRKLLPFLMALVMLLQCGCAVGNSAREKGEEPTMNDNIVISQDNIITNDELEPTASKSSGTKIFYTTEYAYVRGGSNWAGKNWHKILEERGRAPMIIMKNGLSSSDVTRLALFRFDISGLEAEDVGFVQFVVNLSEAQKDQTIHFDLYLVDENWSEDKVTWNTQPKKLDSKPVLSQCVFRSIDKIDATDFILRMIKEGRSSFTLLVVQRENTDTETKIILGSTSESSMPRFIVSSDAGSKDRTYVKQLTGDEKKDQEIWNNAKRMYDEWLIRYNELKKKELPDATLIKSEQSQYTKTVYSPGSNPNNKMIARPTRTYDALTDLSKYVDVNATYEYDIYGGVMDPDLKQEVTGFFYTTKIGDRWWVIDPLGYPCVLRCMSGITYSYQNSPTQLQAAYDKFGTLEKWAIATTRHVVDDLYFNSGMTHVGIVEDVEQGIAYFKRFSAMSGYTSSKGTNVSQGGAAKFSENNTMPVFDPDFVSYVDNQAKKSARPDDPNVIGYITDNELPMDTNMLERYLTIDPTKPANYYSYAAAWYWLTQMTGKEDANQRDITPELSQLFRGFVWDRYYYVVTNAILKYDQNHMLAGTKFLTTVKDAEWVLRFAAEYLDLITINWYGQWEPDAEDVYDIARFGDVPFMVTEFYAKAEENEDKLANHDGAGFFVKTQKDRGYFYQNFTLRMLECKNAIGWQWFQYTDNDPAGNPTDISSRDANKGIVSNTLTEYTDLTEMMIQINKNVYQLIEYFDAKYQK